MVDLTLDLISGAGIWLWEKYGKDITNKAVGLAKGKWETFRWSDAAQLYRERIKTLYSTTRVLGNPKPITLEDIFTDVYLLDKLTALRRYDIEQLKKEYRQELKRSEKDRKHALRVLVDLDRLFILGKPGSGKTTFLKHITLLAAEEKLQAIPIFISCKQWADSGLELMVFLERQFEICAFPDALAFIDHILETGEAIVLFDGVDEISQEFDQRSQLVKTITDFTNQYTGSKCVITCRIAATDYDFDKFTYLEIADFTDRQMQTFVHKWFKDSEIKQRLFLDEIRKPEQTGLRELIRIPLLLTLLCLAFDESMEFPQRRVDIYEEALDALLRKWDAARNIKRDEIYYALSINRKRHMFARIAADSFDKEEYFLREQDLSQKIANYLEKLPSTKEPLEVDGQAVLKTIVAQHGIFVEAAQRLYTFSHETFQEYFTARYIVDNISDGTLVRLVTHHLTDKRWREIFIMTASLLDNADSFFALFKSAIDGLVLQDETLTRVIRWAAQKAEKDYEQMGDPAFTRAIALDIDIDRERAFVSASSMARASSAVQTRDLARALALASSRTGPFVPFPSHDLSRTPSAAVVAAREMSEQRTRTLEISNACSLAVALSRDLAFASNMNISGEIVPNELMHLLRSAFRFCLVTSHNLGLLELYDSLRNLRGPREEDELEKWQNFTSDLRSMLIRYRDIGHEWNLSPQQIEALKQYNEANILLMDCLKVAYVSEREKIEDRLLLLVGGDQ